MSQFHYPQVWFMVRETGTMTGDWNFAPGVTFSATGKSLQVAPSTYSAIYTPDKKIKCARTRLKCSAEH